MSPALRGEIHDVKDVRFCCKQHVWTSPDYQSLWSLDWWSLTPCARYQVSISVPLLRCGSDEDSFGSYEPEGRFRRLSVGGCTRMGYMGCRPDPAETAILKNLVSFLSIPYPDIVLLLLYDDFDLCRNVLNWIVSNKELHDHTISNLSV